jgi:ABC-2 family transporter protein
MTTLLRADWLRLRRRLDVWAILVGILVIGAIGFLNGYKGDSTDPPLLSEAEVRQQVTQFVDFGGMTQAEIDAQIEGMIQSSLAQQEFERVAHEEQQQRDLQKYDVAQAPLTMIGFGIIPLIGLFVVTTLILGDEFRFGTIRASLLASSDRRRFLAARLVTVGALLVGVFASLAILGVVLALALRAVGAELPPAPADWVPLDGAAALGTVAAIVLGGAALLAFGVLLSLLTRSGALPLLLVLVWLFAESFIANLPIFLVGQPLAGVPQLFLTVSVRSLVIQLAAASHAGAFGSVFPPDAAIDLPLWTVTLIVVAWLGLFIALADRRLRRMDIVE